MVKLFGKMFGGLSLRSRIVLWILLLFLIIQITLSLVVLLYARQDVQRKLERSLDQFASVVESEVEALEELPERAQFEMLLAQAIPAEFNDLYGVIVEPRGSGVAPNQIQGGPLGDTLRNVVQERPTTGERTTVFLEAADVLISKETQSVRMANGREARIVVALNSSDAADSTRLIAQMLLVSIPVSTLSLGVAAWVVGGIAVRPLHQVEEFAAQLSPENVGTPIELEAGGSEVDSLRTELGDAMERIEQAYQEQARFLANVSHEIKTPISIVLAEAEVLLMKPREPAEVSKFVKSTAEEMQRLGSMVESFLLLTRVEAGESRVRRKRLDLNELLMDAVEQCHGMASLHSVALHPQLCEDEDPPAVFGNADLLKTAVGNLIRNAIRFTQDEAAVEVSCAVDGDFGLIRVRDRGPGIPEDLLPRLFDPFTQASVERRRGRGTGLGLQIAKGIAGFLSETEQASKRLLDAGV